MSEPTTLEPYELLGLLEQLGDERFSGTVALAATPPMQGRIMLYLAEGTVRYARTTVPEVTFPQYLLRRRLFPRQTLKALLRRSSVEHKNIGDLLREEGLLDLDGLRHLKRDLAAAILSRAYAGEWQTDIRSVPPRPLEYKQPPINPFDALFDSVLRWPQHTVMNESVQHHWSSKLVRGPEFFGLYPVFFRHFGASLVVERLTDGFRLDSLSRRSDVPETALAQIFALRLSRMARFEDEAPTPSSLASLHGPPQDASRAPSAKTVAVAQRRTSVGAKRGDGPPVGTSLPSSARATTIGVRRSPAPMALASTRPGGPKRADKGDLRRSTVMPLEATPLPPEAAMPQRGTNPEGELSPFEGSSEERTEVSLTLNDILVSESLARTAKVALEQSHYRFFDLEPTAPLSRVRSAYLRLWAQYGDDRFEGYHLGEEGKKALAALHGKIDEAYETLTSLSLRRSYDRELLGEADAERLAAMFNAEGRFKAAQLRMTEGRNAEGIELLEQAIAAFPDEPELHSYLGWAIACAQMWDEEVPGGPRNPHEPIARALRMDPTLESGWVFRARIEELAGNPAGALAAFLEVLAANPHNEEAEAAVHRLRATDIQLPERKAGLKRRLARLLGLAED